MKSLPTIVHKINDHTIEHPFIEWIKLISNDCLWSKQTKKKILDSLKK